MIRRILDVRWTALLLAATVVGSQAVEKADKSGVRASGPDTALVDIGPVKGGSEAFVAWPAGGAEAPAVIVVHEWWGLNAQIRRLARRLAHEGYVAIVPDLYHGKVAQDAERAHELARGLDTGEAIADLMAAKRWLRSQRRTGKSRLGVIGFCMGGTLSQEFALDSSDVVAAVMFYGRPETDPKKLARLGCPLQGHFGAEDEGIPIERVRALEAGLKSAGKEGEVFLYPSAGHAFMHEGRPSYHADAARQAWARTLAFFQKRLKG